MPSLENEGEWKGEDETVEGKRLNQPYPQEHKRPRLLKGLWLTVDARYSLFYEVAHPRSGSYDRRAGGDTDP